MIPLSCFSVHSFWCKPRASGDDPSEEMHAAVDWL